MPQIDQLAGRGVAARATRVVVWLGLAAAALVGVLTRVAIATLIALLSWRLLRGAVFARSLSFVAVIAGGALLIGGALTQGLGSLADAMAAADLNGPGGRGFGPLAGRLDFTTIVTGLILLLVGLAFEYGERLQRDTEGLV